MRPLPPSWTGWRCRCCQRWSYVRDRATTAITHDPIVDLATARIMPELNQRRERPAGAIDIDATKPLGQVVDELLRLAD